MERQFVESTMIESVGYESDTAILEVEFKSNNAVWQYYDYPESLWYEFESADSKGKFFNQYIRNQYTESQVG
ncbi:MAG: KTSC domain-containing protein [archaeon]|nr:KTSC domain-containing protein [archaeon]